MSDAIKALYDITVICSKRGSDPDGDKVGPEYLTELLVQIVERAGDALEDHVVAKTGVRPLKSRVYKRIVEEIAVHFCDICDNPEQAFNIAVDVREILAAFDITTVDYTGREVKIV